MMERVEEGSKIIGEELRLLRESNWHYSKSDNLDPPPLFGGNYEHGGTSGTKPEPSETQDSQSSSAESEIEQSTETEVEQSTETESFYRVYELDSDSPYLQRRMSGTARGMASALILVLLLTCFLGKVQAAPFTFEVPYKRPKMQYALTLYDKGNALSVSFYHLLNPLSNAAVGSEISQSQKLS